MSKAFGNFFGGGKPRQVTQPTAFGTLPGFAQGAQEQAFDIATGIPQQAFQEAPITSEQQASLDVLSQGLQPTSAGQFQQGLSTFGDPFQEQVIQNSIRDIQETGAGQFSDISQFADAAGGFGGTRQALLEAELQKNIQRNVGDVSAQLRSQGFQSAADRTLGDIARTQNLAPTLFGLGDIERQIQTSQQQAPIQQSQFLASLAAGVPTGGGQIGFVPQPQGFLQRVGGGFSSLGQGAQGLGTAAGGIAALSDSRVKKNIQKVGNEKGFNIYEFDYIDGSGRFRGVMAQDVLKKNPEAVKIMPNGYFGVIYDMIGIKMEAVA